MCGVTRLDSRARGPCRAAFDDADLAGVRGEVVVEARVHVRAKRAAGDAPRFSNGSAMGRLVAWRRVGALCGPTVVEYAHPVRDQIVSDLVLALVGALPGDRPLQYSSDTFRVSETDS